MDRLRPQRILGTGSHNSERCVEGEETCISPLRLLAAIAGIFFAVEALLMYVLAWVGWPSPLIVPWLDATLLVAVACPSLYLLVIRPLRVAIRRQMTEREQVTEELHKLSQAVEQSPTSILITDLGGCIQYVNPRFCKLTGYTREELLGQNPRLFKSGQNPPEIYQGLWKALKAGNEWRGELCNRKKNGELFWEFAVLSPLRNASGAVTHFIGVKEDITEKKSLEKQLLRAQRLEGIGTLAAGIAHDLNNIIAPIMMSAEILQLGELSQEHAEILATIQGSARRGAEVVKQVLTFARGIEGRRLSLKPKYLLKEMEHMLRETFPKDITCRFNVPKDLWNVTGDSTQLHQVMLNLCVNARDAMPNGGTLTLTAANIQVTKDHRSLFADTSTGPHLLIQVSDTGAGIAADILEKVFEPFFTTKEQGKGTGLGLSTALGIVRSHGGFIDVESELGKGSTFKVYLPAAPGIPTPMPEVGPGLAPRGAGECILVVDDEPSVRSLTESMLSRHGYKVMVAANGKEALALLSDSSLPVNAVISDILMPGMDGLGLVRHLRKSHAALPVIVCTGWGHESTRAKLRELGVESFLEKPYSVVSLLQTLRQVLALAA